MDWVLLSFAVILSVLGIIGCLLPILPGPIFSLIGLILVFFSAANFISNQHIVLIIIAVTLVSIIDFYLPIWGTKKMGGSKAGIRGSTFGLLIGLFFSPFGFISLIIGPIIGAFLGEMIHQKNNRTALKSAIGSFIGFLIGTGLKLMLSIYLAYIVFQSVYFYLI